MDVVSVVVEPSGFVVVDSVLVVTEPSSFMTVCDDEPGTYSTSMVFVVV